MKAWRSGIVAVKRHGEGGETGINETSGIIETT